MQEETSVRLDSVKTLQQIWQLTVIANNFSSYIFCTNNFSNNFTKTKQTNVFHCILSHFCNFQNDILCIKKNIFHEYINYINV